jgi:hypothetical protein
VGWPRADVHIPFGLLYFILLHFIKIWHDFRVPAKKRRKTRKQLPQPRSFIHVLVVVQKPTTRSLHGGNKMIQYEKHVKHTHKQVNNNESKTHARLRKQDIGTVACTCPLTLEELDGGVATIDPLAHTKRPEIFQERLSAARHAAARIIPCRHAGD